MYMHVEAGIIGQSYGLEKKKPEMNWCTLGLRPARSFPINVPESKRSNAGDFGIALPHLDCNLSQETDLILLESHAIHEFCVTTASAHEYDTHKEEVDRHHIHRSHLYFISRTRTHAAREFQGPFLRIVSACMAWINASRLWNLSEHTK